MAWKGELCGSVFDDIVSNEKGDLAAPCSLLVVADAISGWTFVSADVVEAAAEVRGATIALFDGKPLVVACFTSCVPDARATSCLAGAGDPKPFTKAFGGAGVPKGWATWSPKAKPGCGGCEGCVADDD